MRSPRIVALLMAGAAGCASSRPARTLELDLPQMLAVVEGSLASGELAAAVPGVDPAVLIWSLLRDEADGEVAEAARRKLAERFEDVALEPGAARLLYDGAGEARMADGTLVDWSKGEPSSPPRAEAEMELVGEGGAIVAGTPARMRVKVKNVGKGALHQLRATASSDSGSAIVLIGKIPPGGVVERIIAMPTPPTLEVEQLAIALQFTELNGYAPEALMAKVAIDAAPRPVLAISVRALDDGSGSSVGNGDGVVQRGEAIDLLIGVRNVGGAPSVDTHLDLAVTEQQGVAIFGPRAHDLGALAPGATAEVRVTVSVKPGFAGTSIPLSASAKETSRFASAAQADLTLGIDQRAPERMIQLDRPVVATQEAQLLERAAADARPIGKLEKGSRVRAVGELGAYVQVEYGPPGSGKRAWIASAAVTAAAKAGGDVPAPAEVGTTAVVREIANTPPLIAFLTPAEGAPVNTAEPEVEVKAIVRDAEGLSEVKLLVNGAPIADTAELLRGVRAKPAAPGKPEPAPKLVNVARRVKLVPGENRIAIAVRDSDGEPRETQVVVVRSVREPLVVALVVGVNRYDDPEIPALAYAEADAQAVAEFLRGPRSPVKDPADVVALIGKDATATNIRVWIDKHLVSRASHPEDMAILYFAGHGFTAGDRYFLAGTDTRLTSLRGTAVRDSELQELWQDIRAERKLFIADACHAGGLKGMRGDNEVSRGLMQATAAGRGRISILAAREKQQSVEIESRGHGAFTLALIEGLAGRADAEAGNHDGRVSVKELVGFLDREVPALARSVGHEQNPIHEETQAEGDLYLTR